MCGWLAQFRRYSKAYLHVFGARERFPESSPPCALQNSSWICDEGEMSNGAPCGACKFLRRKCVNNCIFAPHFNSEQGAARFAAVHKIFGASNVTKLLHHIPMAKRSDAVLTISYEAQARLSDPVYGCVATIVALQHQVASLQGELMNVQMQLSKCVASLQQQQQQQQQQQHQQQHQQQTSSPPAYDQVFPVVPMPIVSAGLGVEIQSGGPLAGGGGPPPGSGYMHHHHHQQHHQQHQHHQYRGGGTSPSKDDFCGTSSSTSPPPLVSVVSTPGGAGNGNSSNNNVSSGMLKTSSRSLDVDDETTQLQQFWPGTTPTAIA